METKWKPTGNHGFYGSKPKYPLIFLKLKLKSGNLPGTLITNLTGTLITRALNTKPFRILRGVRGVSKLLLQVGVNKTHTTVQPTTLCEHTCLHVDHDALHDTLVRSEK